MVLKVGNEQLDGELLKFERLQKVFVRLVEEEREQVSRGEWDTAGARAPVGGLQSRHGVGGDTLGGGGTAAGKPMGGGAHAAAQVGRVDLGAREGLGDRRRCLLAKGDEEVDRLDGGGLRLSRFADGQGEEGLDLIGHFHEVDLSW